ncbi:hypothetical protein L1987_09231 [Smallanthus sonchifolius]|uniref:Uncharacterized protein n=1 Tax=Smallanthus sonchifolius TaxID=185202 RepID=A0ACB9JMU8_9ASTR|nr:hypothetical protein L1987_09231 [Smallanthus sonchifolius]
MDRDYGSYSDEYSFDLWGYHEEIWCEIFGGPHYTLDCYQFPGYPARRYEDPIFGPVGDLDELETLFFEGSTVVIKGELHQKGVVQTDGFTNKPMTMVTPDPPLCTKKSRPAIGHDHDSSYESSEQREKARHFTDQPTWKARHRSTKHGKSTLSCRDDRLLRYIMYLRYSERVLDRADWGYGLERLRRGRALTWRDRVSGLGLPVVGHSGTMGLDFGLGAMAGNRDHPYLEFDLNKHEYEARLDYVELVMEFFSTYEFDYPCADLEQPDTIRFRLGGEWRVMSVARFGRLLGLYTRQERQTELFTKGITEFPTEEDKDQFWHEFGFGMYDPSLTKASSLRDPLHCVLHRCIVYSISGRGQGETVVNLRELFYQFCLVRPRTCNLAHSIAGYLVNSSGRDVTSAICGGHSVTKLARYFQLLTDDLIGDLTFVVETVVMTVHTLRNMHVARRGAGGIRLAEAEAVAAAHQAHAAQQGHEHQEPDQPPPPSPPPPPPAIVIPHDLFMRYWTWQYEVQCAAAAAGGAPYVVPLPFFMQPEQQPDQPPPSPPHHQPPPSPPHHQSPPPSPPAA